jgi:DNA-binding XRE family transcriptional regulator
MSIRASGTFNEWLTERRSEPEFNGEFERLSRIAELGIEIRRLRTAARLSQTQLAHRACASRYAVARLEAGEAMPRLDVLDRIAQALGAKVELKLLPAPAA